MDDQKGPSLTADSHDSHNSLELANAVAVGEKQGTHNDETDMDRMGKLQVLRVRSYELFIEASLC
jgi:choline transport protein